VEIMLKFNCIQHTLQSLVFILHSSPHFFQIQTLANLSFFYLTRLKSFIHLVDMTLFKEMCSLNYACLMLIRLIVKFKK